jgi:uncharacterized protein
MDQNSRPQIVVIGGGDSFATYDQYLNYWKTRPATLDNFRYRPDWKYSLPADLGSDFETLVPTMPNRDNAVYLEWQIWFERLLPFLKSDVVLIGHSLGGSFLAKYLSENIFPVRIKALFLVAAAHKNTTDCGEFVKLVNLAKVNEQCPRVFLYHSQDDQVVPFSELAVYACELPKAETKIFADRGHFKQPHFPELIEELKKLF